jgi:methylaspartate ammonia-lyase
MTRITKVLAVPASGALYYEDISALQAHGTAAPENSGAGSGIVRATAQAVSVGLLLDDGRVAWGDCVALAEADGTYPAHPVGPFRAASGVETLRRTVAPVLEGRELTGFRELVSGVEGLRETVVARRPVAGVESKTPSDDDVRDPSRRALLTAAARLLSPYADGEPERSDLPMEEVEVERPLHPGIRYGVSQALLKGAALVRGLTMAEVVAEEWGLPKPGGPVPIHAQAVRDPYMDADKMIVHRIAALPGARFSAAASPNREGQPNLARYLKWLTERIAELGGGDYRPYIHLNAEGALGRLFENRLGRILGQLYAWEYGTAPYRLQVSDPLVLETREAQIAEMKTLVEYTRFRKMRVQLVADHWINNLSDVHAFLAAGAAHIINVNMPALGGLQNSVEAALACRAADVGVVLGGSAAETDLSARVAAHVALAVHPDFVTARPGGGMDEGITILQNEMVRTLAWMDARSV